jgi:acetylornithine deacetylase/succinyl-diaminopimelate desuccinylase-like protein
MVDQQETVRQYSGDLSGEWPVIIQGRSYRIRSRHTYSGEPIQKATRYVGDHLAALGLIVEYHDWDPDTAPNVIGQATGATNPGHIFMVTAHLDDMSNDTVAPGADDNASGSVGVLVTADILSQFSWNCTLRFALWTGEEQGLLGSDKYALRAKNNVENIVGVFNLDMIAWNTQGSTPDIDLHANSSMPRTVDLAKQVASVVDAYDLR